MSNSPEAGSSEPDLDLDLQLLPAWAQRPPAENQYSKFEGDTGDRRGRRGDHRQDRRGPRHRDTPRGGQPGRDRPPPGDRPRRPRPEGRPPYKGAGRPEDRRAPEPPEIEIQISLIPDERGVESLAKQIRMTGRAYPLFDIAFLILKKPDRYNVQYSVISKPDGKVAQPLFLCDLDETLWLSEREAIDHILDKHFATFYQTERTPTDPPKGTYTFVAQCGMSGAILGPPNYHDYQNKLRKLHSERFSRMPFETFKSRIKIVRDEAIVKKWIDDQSWKTDFICLNVPEALKLGSRDEVEKHFREVHFPNVVKSIESRTISAVAAQQQPLRSLQNLVRRTWEDQMRFPLRVVTVLSQQLATHGMQFFKVNKTVTHVSVARPRYLDPEVTPVSEGIIRIVEFIKSTQDCTRRKLLTALAPEVDLKSEESAEAAPETEKNAPSPEAAAVVADLHWLIYEGHVIEFSNGLIELAKKPAVNPPQPKPASKATAKTEKTTPEPGNVPPDSGAPAAAEENPSTVSNVPENTAATGSDKPAEDQEVTPPAPPATEDSANENRAAAPLAQPSSEDSEPKTSVDDPRATEENPISTSPSDEHAGMPEGEAPRNDS